MCLNSLVGCMRLYGTEGCRLLGSPKQLFSLYLKNNYNSICSG